MYAHTSGALKITLTKQLKFGLNTSAKESYMGEKHRVKTHRWERGVLQTIEHWFDSLEEATLFSGNVDAHTVKVYNPAGEIVSSRTLGALPGQVNTRRSPVTANIVDTSYTYPDLETGYSY